MRVLLIESEQEDVVFLRDVLSEIAEGRHWNNWVDMEVLEATSWSEASSILATEQIDITLLDLDILDSNGIATFRLAQREAEQVPMVLLIGQSEESLGLRLIREGAQDFLVKKLVDCAPLAHAMKSAIERHRLLTALRAASTHDTLTGLMNRAGFLVSTDRERKLAERLGRRLMVIIAEPENLGEMETSYGEQARDLTLVETADHLRGVAGPTDLLARVGSTRFGITIVETEVEPLEEIQAGIQSALRPLRIRIGAAIFLPRQPATLDELLAEAASDLVPTAVAIRT